jgi:hypothetical protein
MRLLHRACRARKRIVRISTYEADGADHKDQNHCEHDRILGDVLAFLGTQKFYDTQHFGPLWAGIMKLNVCISNAYLLILSRQQL